MDEIIVSMVNVEKFYGNNHVVKNMNLKVMAGEFLTLLGPSGCGKTTTLRMISGFESPSAGIIKVENENVMDKAPNKRNVNTVFQNYALFPNMNVFNNIAYGLKVKKVEKTEIKKRVDEMIELVQLRGFEKRRIDQLSGGQRQRVAIARALINRPKVLLLDEPLGALDMKLRKQMQIELKRLQRQLGITFIFVTHDQEEALIMSDRIAIFNNGAIEQIGTPEDIYQHPKTRFVADFMGESNLFDGIVKKIDGEHASISTETGYLLTQNDNLKPDDRVSVVVRPEKTKLSLEKQENFGLYGKIVDVIYAGSIVKILVQLSNGNQIRVNRFQGEVSVHKEDVVFVYWDTKDAVVIKSEAVIQ